MRNRLATIHPLAVVLVGAVVVVGMVGLSDYATQQLVDRVTALNRLTDEVALGVTSSHLRLEEYLAGDEGEGPAPLRPGDQDGSTRILTELDTARGSCAALWSSGLLDAGHQAARAEQLGMSLCDRIDELHTVTVERLADPQASGPGSAVDGRYDELFWDVRGMAGDVNVAIETQIAEEREHLTLITVVLVSLVLAAFTLMGIFVHRATARAAAVEQAAARGPGCHATGGPRRRRRGHGRLRQRRGRHAGRSRPRRPSRSVRTGAVLVRRGGGLRGRRASPPSCRGRPRPAWPT